MHNRWWQPMEKNHTNINPERVEHDQASNFQMPFKFSTMYLGNLFDVSGRNRLNPSKYSTPSGLLFDNLTYHGFAPMAIQIKAFQAFPRCIGLTINQLNTLNLQAQWLYEKPRRG
jgi:hypothetical protein